MGPRRAARSGLMALALLCCMVGTFSQSTQKFNITKMLAGQPRFSVLREMLSSLGVAAEINGRKSVTLLAPANNVMRAFRTNNNKTDAIKITDLLRFHVLLTYFDMAELRALKTTNYTSVTTLLQTTGRASGNNGDLKISIERKRDPNHAGEYFEFFDGMQFKDGYLYKGVSLKSIDSNGVLGLELAHVDTSERARIL
ncbi:hypothetical protein AXG93_115s1550 [Marchantia polymorpha subsp. ruderalis]|uniref:FAS1 domain-containing protein n=1 Tax=Marchantia polymorpha subsp. ruderalis TaxID=1480154 RepID=A0A176W633_MARPO|nr:hypothetical protein AXG93_115s1550 [Marchantia polymorpha subsp. ruderalis]